MSTKIYTAYRLKKGVDLWDWCAETQKQAEQNIQAILRTVYRAWVDSTNFHPMIREALKMLADERIEWYHCGMYMAKRYHEQLGNLARNDFNLDVEIAIRRCGRRYYLIPYCDGIVRGVLNFLAQDPCLEDYAYWNNSDPPDEISPQAWAARERTWEKMFKRWQDMLVLHICSYSGFYRINLLREHIEGEA